MGNLNMNNNRIMNIGNAIEDNDVVNLFLFKKVENDLTESIKTIKSYSDKNNNQNNIEWNKSNKRTAV